MSLKSAATAENPDRKRDCHADPFSLLRLHCCGSAMPDTPLRPSNLIATNEALEELLALDPLIAAWRAAGSPFLTARKPKTKLPKATQQANKLYLQAENSQRALIAEVLEALRTGKLEAFPMNLAREPLPPPVLAYWDDVRGAASVVTGRLRGDVSGLPDPESHALCFERGAWAAWCARQWWTIPQAAVWIRTRDLALVRSLPEKARVYLFVADAVAPGSFTAATVNLLAAFKNGRVVPHGWPRGEDHIRRPIRGDYWRAGASFSESDAGVEAMLPTLQDPMEGLTVEANDVLGHWPCYANLLEDGPLPLWDAIGWLPEEDCPTWLLQHPSVMVTGLDADAVRQMIDKDVFRTDSIVNPDHASISTADGRHTWSSVMVEWISAAPPDTPEQTTAAPAEPSLHKVEGGRTTMVAQCRDFLLQLFPDGKVVDSYSTLRDRIHQRFGKTFEKDVIRRAVGKKKP
jgi:hypothetical protein